MNRTSKDFLEYIISLFPLFEQYWNSVDNYFLDDDGSFSVYGVCAQFSHYFYEPNNIQTFPEESLIKLFEFIEIELSADDSVLDNPICTCFLENIACTEAGEDTQKFMGEKTKSYFLEWHRS